MKILNFCWKKVDFWQKIVNFQNFLILSKIHIFLIPLCRRHFRNISKDLSMEFWWKSTFVVLMQFYEIFMFLMIFVSVWGSCFFICGPGKHTKCKKCFLKILCRSWKCIFIYPNDQKKVIFLGKKWSSLGAQKKPKKSTHIWYVL